jgi:ATP-binding cassette subfamily C (CFTR/MRP) protein 1
MMKCFVYVQTNMVNVARCLTIMEIPKENEQGVKVEDGWPTKGELEFKGVSAKYREGEMMVLKGVSAKLKEGEKIGVVGRTGSGKSTICLALTRIIELSEGSITIDGLDISQISLSSLRNRITVIP